MKYYDIHTHLLPCIDDGSQSIEESIELINRLKSAGVGAIAFTPHYYSNHEPVSDFVKKRDEAFINNIDLFPSGITYTVGAEVFVTDLLFGANDISELCYKGTDYMLTEFSYDISVSRAVNYIEKLKSTFGIIPVIAHIERYPEVLSVKGAAALLNAGAFIQTNIDSLSGGFFKRKKIMPLINNDLIHFIGTDTHSLEARCPDFTKCSDNIIRYCGKRFFYDCMTFAERLFINEVDKP